MERSSRLRALVIVSAFSLILTGCSSVDNTNASNRTSSAAKITPAPGARTPEQSAQDGPVTVEKAMKAHNLSGMDPMDLVNHLEQMPLADRPTNIIASVRHGELLIRTDIDETILPLPSDQIYVSIAPYATQTHDCFYHSLTTCVGELGNEDITVTITDDATGEVLINENVRTLDNGFVGFWLPAGLAGTINVEHDGRSGTTPFNTDEDGATCVTTLQVA